MLNGFDGNRHQIVNKTYFFLKEWLSVRDAAKHSVESSHGVDPGANLVRGREEVLAGILIAELRLVGEDRGELRLELITDVDHECRPDIVVERGVDDLEGTVRS